MAQRVPIDPVLAAFLNAPVVPLTGEERARADELDQAEADIRAGRGVSTGVVSAAIAARADSDA